jgi:aldehyde dehydrogenase (NAD+)
MTNKDYSALVATQREYFLSGQTRSASWRRSQLEALKALFQENHDELCDALWKDLRRNVVDADLLDIAYNVKEADYALKHLAEWMKPERVPTPLVLEPGHVRVRRDPLGVTLIIGAWKVRRRRQFRDGQVSRPVRLRGVHQRPRRLVSQLEDRPRRALSSLFATRL